MSKKNRLLLLLGLNLLAQLIAGIYACQSIAEILDYQPALYGSFSWLGFPHVYFPFIWISWYLSYGSEAAWIFEQYALNPALYALGAAMLISCVIFARCNKPKNDTHGSAHFATEKEIVEYSFDPDGRTAWEKFLVLFHPLKWFKDNRHRNDNDLFSGEGIFLGCLDNGKYIRDNSKTHVLICAPTRSGKGVGHIVPTLLAWGGSVIVTDIKGENWELTAGFRKAKLNNDVFMFKPTSRESCHYNPLDEIRIGTPYEMNDLQLITKILVDPTGKGGDGNNAHWVNNAWDLLQGVVLHLLYAKRFHNGNEPGRTANLSDVLDFLYDGQNSEGKSSSEKAKALEDQLEAEKKRKEEFEKTTELSIVTASQALANLEKDAEEDNDISDNKKEDTSFESEEEAKPKPLVVNLFSAQKQYANSLIDFGEDDDFFEDEDYEDEPSDAPRKAGDLLKAVAADNAAKIEAKKDMPEVTVDVKR